MIRMMSNGTSGMLATETALTNTSNNISNSQTTAYKKQLTNFEEVFYQEIKTPSAPNGNYAGTNGSDVGNGVRTSSISTDFSQGSVNSTGNKTDLGIQGDGFFVVGDSNGNNKLYTRAGNFDLSKDNQLVTKNGQYVLGWNMDKITGAISSGAALAPITIPLGQISKPNQSTQMSISGNIDISMNNGESYGLQVPSYDSLGVHHDIDINFVKTGGNQYRYIMTPVDQFKTSASVDSAILRSSDSVATLLKKGDYQIKTAPSATPGDVDITVTDPTGATVLTQSVTDVNQSVTLSDGTNNWFTIDYKSGGAPSTATYTVGEVGDITFNTIGQVSNITGSSASGKPEITYTPSQTGTPVNIDVTMDTLTGLSTDSGIKMDSTDGAPSAVLSSYTISDGGTVSGEYSDGSIKPIGQIALATFPNAEGLTKVGSGYYTQTVNSGLPDVGMPNTSSRGQIKSQALEMSNVDLASEFVDLMGNEKAFQANTKVIRGADDILTSVINLIQ